MLSEVSICFQEERKEGIVSSKSEPLTVRHPCTVSELKLVKCLSSGLGTRE